MASDGSLIRDLDDEDAARAIIELLEEPYRQLVFSSWDQEFLTTEEGRHGMRIALVDRYLASRRHAAAWLEASVGLGGKSIVEVGCGTGSSTVALAERGAQVFAIDIDQASVTAAQHRVQAHQVEGVTLHKCEPDEILDVALGQQADLFVLFAVLEHLTEAERFSTLHDLWHALEPGGAIAIIETPNRLSYFDSHSSEQDYVHLLPDGLAFRLTDLSPRYAYRDVMGRARDTGDADAAHLTRVRFGLGASFHEFVAAVDAPLNEIVIADGYEPAITSWFGMNLEEVTLLQYMLQRDPGVPMAFARPVLNLVLRKPVDDHDRSSTVERNRSRRLELSTLYGRAPTDWQAQLAQLNGLVDAHAGEIERLQSEIARLSTPQERGTFLGKLRSKLR